MAESYQMLSVINTLRMSANVSLPFLTMATTIELVSLCLQTFRSLSAFRNLLWTAISVIIKMVEKLSKALEGLKNIQFITSEDEAVISKKGKMFFCVLAADMMVSLKAEGLQNLPIVIEDMINLCDDKDSDVRMVADESLNRIIMSLSQANMLKVQVELHSIIKKNGPARCLRAALVRFGQLSHFIRPNKGREHVQMLVPALIEIAKREEESIHETLASSLENIFKVLGVFVQDNALKGLIKAFLHNLSSINPVIRRCSASCIITIVQYCRKPIIFSCYILNSLLDCIVPICEGNSTELILGVLGCLRILLPALVCAKNDEGISGSFGVRRRQDESLLSVDRLIQAYELCLHYASSKDHNVVTAALETLNQILQNPPLVLESFFLSPSGFSRSYIHSGKENRLWSRSGSEMSVALSTIDETLLLDDNDVASEFCSFTCGEEFQTKQTFPKSKTSATSSDNDKTVENPFKEKSFDKLEGSQSNLEVDSDTESIASDSTAPRNFLMRIETEDREIGVPEIERSKSNSRDEMYSPSESERLCFSSPIDVGTFTDAAVPLVHCARYLAASFLLDGAPKCLKSDRNVRVSVKSLALSCLSAVVRLHPAVMALNVGKGQTELCVQGMSDIFLYSNHGDPQIRGNVSILIGSFINSALRESKNFASDWLSGENANLTSKNLINILLKGLQDESSVCARHTLTAVKLCITRALFSVYNTHFLPLLEHIPAIAGHSYWLVKVKLVEVLSDLPYMCISDLTGSEDFQDQVVNRVLLLLLGDEDSRVRQATAEALVRLVPALHLGQSTVLEYGKTFADYMSCFAMRRKDSTIEHSPCFPPPPFSHLSSDADENVDCSLSLIVAKLTCSLIEPKNKYFLFGYLEALMLLSEKYPTTVYSKGWNCTRSDSEESNCGLKSGLISVVMSLILTSPFDLDLATFSSATRLLGNLFAGLSVCYMKRSEEVLSSLVADQPLKLWAVFKNDCMSLMAEEILTHLLKVLNLYSRLLEEVTLSSAVESSAANAFFLSPNKKQDKKLEEKADERRNKTHNACKQTLQYGKLQQMLTNAYTNYKVSLGKLAGDKFLDVLESTLYALSVLLEVATVRETGRCAEETLSYLLSAVSLKPGAAVICVIQLLRSIFGTNLACNWEEEKFSDLNLRGVHLFDVFFHLPAELLSEKSRRRVNSNTLECEAFPERSRKAGRKVVIRNSDESWLATHIRLFEPIIVRSLKLYTISGDVELQANVLSLLNQLVQLRVNYCMLDEKQIFLDFVLKQFELMERAQIPGVEKLLPCIFRFLVLLSYGKQHSKPIMSIPRILQLCDGLMASDHSVRTHCIPALGPVVEDIFFSRSLASSLEDKELETQREVMFSMLLRLSEFPEVMEMLSAILDECRLIEGKERWKRWSRQVVDSLLPLLSQDRLRIDSVESQRSFAKLMYSLSPNVLRPINPLLKTLFVEPADQKCPTSLKRWISKVTVLLGTVLFVKEDALLNRLDETQLNVNLTTLLPSGTLVLADPFDVTSFFQTFEPSETVARFLLKVISIAVATIEDSSSCSYVEDLQQKLSMFFVCTFHILKSGTFHRITNSLRHVLVEERDSLARISSAFRNLTHVCPVLTCQFSYFLSLLNHCDRDYWAEIVRSPCTLSAKLVQSCGIVALCDHLCDDVSDKETLRFLMENYLDELIALSHEIPVKEVFMTMQGRKTEWALLLETAFSKSFIGASPRHVERLLRLVETSEGCHGGAVLRLTVERFLGSPRLALSLLAGSIACRQAEHLLTLPKEQVIEQISVRQFRGLFDVFKHKNYSKRHSTLWSLLEKLSAEVFEPPAAEGGAAELIEETDLKNLKNVILDEDWYFAQVKRVCCQTSSSVGVEVSLLLNKLRFERILDIMSSPDFNLKILQYCLLHPKADGQKHQEQENKNHELEGSLYEASKRCLLTKVREMCGASRKNKGDEGNFRLKEEHADQFWEICDCLASHLEVVRENYLEMESEWVENIAQFGILCLKAMEWEIRTEATVARSGHVHPKHLENGLKCCGAVLRCREVSNLLSTRENCSLGECAEALVLVVRHLVPRCRLSSVLGGRELTSGRESDRLEFLLSFIEGNREDRPLPHYLMASLRDVVVHLCRIPAISCRVLSVPESCDLQDVALLKSFIARVSLVGWSTRQQFEEIWVALLSVLGLNTQGDIPVEENAFVVQATAIAVEGITALLKSTLAESGRKRLVHHGRDSLSMESIYEKVPVVCGAYDGHEPSRRAFQFLDNLELCRRDERYVHGLMSVEYLWTAVKQITGEMKVYKRHREELTAVGVDLPSCVYLLTELYNQWIYQASPDMRIVTSVLKSSIVISDLFTDISQFQWLLNFCLRIEECIIPEDTVILPLLILACCKAAAIVIPDEEVCRKIKKLMLRSKSLPCRLSAVEGLLYLLQRYTLCHALNHTALPPPGSPIHTDEANFIVNIVNIFLPVALEVVREFRLDKEPRTNEYYRCHWSLIFYLLQHYQSSLGDLKEELLNSIVATLCSRDCRTSIATLLVRGTQRLLLTTMIDENLREQLGKASLEIISFGHSSGTAGHGLQLLAVLSFLDKRMKDIRQLVTGQEDPEKVMRDMEKVNILFEKLKKSYPKEAEVIGRVITYVVEDFSASDVLTKVIQEFLFPHQPHQRVLAGLLFKVFERAEQSLLEDWVVFSLPGFVQGLPVPMSVWTLNCFFVSASGQPWLRFLFPLVQGRVRLAEAEDRRLLCLSAARFYSQLKHDSQRKSFAETFEKAKAIDSVFTDLLSTIS